MPYLRVKICDGGRVVNKSAYLAVGVDLDRIKHVLGMWIAIEEGGFLVGAGMCIPVELRGCLWRAVGRCQQR